MQCPQCAGQIEHGARFCGICGCGIESPAAPHARARRKSMSLFELPPARGPRILRVSLILLLDVILAGSGIAMMMSYMNARNHRAQAAITRQAGDDGAENLALPLGDAGVK